VTARCEFSDLPPEQCAHCQGHVEPRPDAVRELPRGVVEARYRGSCAGCGEPYAVGALIEYDPSYGRWVAECCALDPEVDW
jgi:hypothetical protein